MNIRHGTFGRVLLVLSLGLAVGLCAPSLAATQASQTAAADKPFVVEYYYKARWGYADEFIRLFKKNHWPVLKKEMELGRILQVTATSPRYHATITKQLFPDQETFKREEQRRFEILLAHWDLPIVDVDLNK